MSCFIVEPATLAVVVAVWRKLDREHGASYLRLTSSHLRPTDTVTTGDPTDPDLIGADEYLWSLIAAENVASYEARYRGEKCAPHMWDRRIVERASAHLRSMPDWRAYAAKILDCYEYQACEHDEWEASKAARAIDGLRRQLLSSLPGYSAAPWGVSSLP